MIWIVLFIVAIIACFEISNRTNTRQRGMTREERLADDISQLSPEWQKTIQIYQETKKRSLTELSK